MAMWCPHEYIRLRAGLTENAERSECQVPGQSSGRKIKILGENGGGMLLKTADTL